MSLFLQINNNTVDADGTTASGYSTSEIYLLIQAQIEKMVGGKKTLVYHWLDWTSGQWKEMSQDDNKVSLDLLGVDPNVLYANYGKSLKEILVCSWVSDGKIPLATPLYGGRCYVSFGSPVYMHINAGPAPAEPSTDTISDPNYALIWDKFEFAVGDDNVLFSNTTAVDFVGIPSKFSVTQGATKLGPQGFDIIGNAVKAPMAYIAADILADANFKKLVTDFRIFAPKESSESFAPDFGEDGNYLDAYIDYCWTKYPAGNKITLWNYVDITKAENSSLKDDKQGKSVTWTVSGYIEGTVLKFTLESLICKDGTSLDLPSNTAFTIAKPGSYDTFRQGGVFDKDDTLHKETYTQQIDGDIKNQVSSALNRCVMHGEYKGPFSDGDQKECWWAEVSAFYKQNDVPAASYKTNDYSNYLHQKSINGLCYALAYDDKYGQNVNLSAGDVNTKETVMDLDIYFKKSGNGELNTFSQTTDGFTVAIKPDADNPGNVGIISVTPPAGKTFEYVYVMYQDAPSHQPAEYPASKMENNQLPFMPRAFGKPFRFYIKYRLNGETAEELLPRKALSDGDVYEYNYD